MSFRGPVIVFLALLAYAVLHSALATRRAKKWAHNIFGEAGVRYYRFIYNVLGVITLLPVLGLLAANPGDEIYRLSGPWFALALTLQGIGALIIAVGLMQTGLWSFFGLDWKGPETDLASETLVTTGLYRWMRHPLYTGGLLLIWFVPLMTTSLLSFNIAATLYLYIGSIFEERRLLAAFGEEYDVYKNRVSRFIPRFRKTERG